MHHRKSDLGPNESQKFVNLPLFMECIVISLNTLKPIKITECTLKN
jgi:hypothetical protein